MVFCCLCFKVFCLNSFKSLDSNVDGKAYQDHGDELGRKTSKSLT